MESEYQVLTHLQENETTTQRHISKNTGLSLGAVNLLLKKMARKGLVKIEKLNSRTVRYILTPQGMKEKTRLAYSFVRSSYRQISKINQAIETLLNEQYCHGSSDRVVLYGPADEVEQILKTALRGLTIKPLIRRPEEDDYLADNNHLILTWRYEDEEQLPGHGRVFNIMKLI